MLASLPLPASDIGVWFTVATMRGMVYREFLSPTVRLTASNIVGGLGGKDGVEQASAIRDWLESHTEFLRDPDNVEMLHGPVWQLQQIHKRGVVRLDCDDVAMLAAALGKAIGLRARFVVLAFGGGGYRHVFTELSPRGTPQWVDMDVTRESQSLPGGITRAFAKDV
jgi:transglutaminase-like putative cysteine protease